MTFGISLAAWAQANPLPPPASLPPHWLAPPIPRPEPAGFITGDWSVEYPPDASLAIPKPLQWLGVTWVDDGTEEAGIKRDVFPRQAMRDKP